MAIRRDLTAFGLAMLLWALQGTAWAQAVDQPAIAAQPQAMLPHATTEPSPGDASMAKVRNFHGARLRCRSPRRRSASGDASNRATAATRARFDLNATRPYLSVLHDPNRGQVDPALSGPAWALPVKRDRPDMTLLSQAVDALDLEQAFARARPAHATYQRFRAALARYRDPKSRGGWRPLANPWPCRPGPIVTTRSWPGPCAGFGPIII